MKVLAFTHSSLSCAVLNHAKERYVVLLQFYQEFGTSRAKNNRVRLGANLRVNVAIRLDNHIVVDASTQFRINDKQLTCTLKHVLPSLSQNKIQIQRWRHNLVNVVKE